MPRFHTASMEPPDEDARWHLCLEQYEASGDLKADSLDWIGTAELTDEQEAIVADWYLNSSACVTAIEDRLDGAA